MYDIRVKNIVGIHFDGEETLYLDCVNRITKDFSVYDRKYPAKLRIIYSEEDDECESLILRVNPVYPYSNYFYSLDIGYKLYQKYKNIFEDQTILNVVGYEIAEEQ